MAILFEPVTTFVNWVAESTLLILPILINVAIILLLGWLVAKSLEKVLLKLLKELGFNDWEERHKIKKALYGLELSKVMALSLKWYIFLVFINEAAVQLNLTIITQLIQAILIVAPNWVTGIALLGGASILGSMVSEHLVKYKILFGDVAGKIAYIIIVYFALVLALPKFGFENTAILTDSFRLLAAGFSAGIAIAVGISFGIALKQPAKKLVKDLIK